MGRGAESFRKRIGLLVVAVVLSVLQVRAYFLSLFGRPQEW